MPNKMQTWSDQEMEKVIGNLLRIGVMLAGAIVAIGGVFFLIHHGLQLPQYKVFRGQPAELTAVHKIIDSALTFYPRAVIQFGFMVLIATPVARVALSVYGFLRQRDFTYVIVTLIVLVILIISLTGITS
jgi:uncharacterized membrane protein